MFIKKFESFINEEMSTPAPARPRPGTPTRPDQPERPTRPEQPSRPEKPSRPERPEEEPTITPIETPVVDPDPMAHGIAKKFINDLAKKGITPKKYKN